MKLSIGLAKKLLRVIQGESLPRSQVQYAIVDRMVEEGVLFVRSKGTRQSIYCRDATVVHHYLKNQLGVNDLSLFVGTVTAADPLRSDAVRAASDSKIKAIRSFKGFLINCNRPLDASLNGTPLQIVPLPGTFTYIYDFEHFFPAEEIVIVGVENGENFRYIEWQEKLFPLEKVLFVSRYPQSGDLLRWLQTIPNRYLHFGDFDFSGINIYLNEFKQHLGARADFFVPDGIADLFHNYGNRDLYDRQCKTAPQRSRLQEPALEQLWDLISTEKKGLEQEVLIKGRKSGRDLISVGSIPRPLGAKADRRSAGSPRS